MKRKMNIDENIFKEHNVKFAYLFGSRAKGKAAKESDFDLAVLFDKKPGDALGLREITALSVELDKFFPAPLDVVCLNDAPSLLKYEVISNGYPLYSESEKNRINFEVSIIKEYIDEQPVRELYNRALHKRILKGA